jgi:hypothetical protein
MPDFTNDDLDRAQQKARPKGKIPYPPDREATLGSVREWLSNAAGLPPEVRIEVVLRPGREPEDPLTIVLSNGMKLRCPHQSRLQQPRTLQAFLVSESDGIAQPSYLSPSEAGDFYGQLCRLGTVGSRSDPVADLDERLNDYIRLCLKSHGSISDRAARYTTIEEIRARQGFTRSIAMGMRNGVPEVNPVLLVDDHDGRRYIRASEWVVYLRFVVGWTVNESQLVGRMAELGSERSYPEMWNADRSHKTHLVFYSVPEKS